MTVLDTIMVIAFIGFMVFIFGGYHKTKFKQREEQEKKKKDS
ncbi:hypothetical protein [Sulfurimonas marina]|nr:hypothetical protein [Sulfurimonas marina]